jgi:L-ascorbate metabolism protein UlaG (beta-lactamase superfamily)
MARLCSRRQESKGVLVDPWLHSNPSCPDHLKKPWELDLILVTHGHSDHIDDLVVTARDTAAPTVAIFERCAWLSTKGIASTAPMNKGGWDWLVSESPWLMLGIAVVMWTTA